MRYYSLLLNTNAEQIEEKARIRLRDYDYETVCAMNSYFYQKLSNHVVFLAYRQEERSLRTEFAFDEQKKSFSDVLGEISGILSDVFGLEKLKKKMQEITIYEFLEALYEAKRRNFTRQGSLLADRAGLWLYELNYSENPEAALRFRFEERMISDSVKSDRQRKYSLYDPDFRKELERIESHKNASGLQSYPVHYILSSDSMEAAVDMAQTLAASLWKANRITGRRLEVISEMDPEAFKGSHIEDIIENNLGGIVMLDLSERFGHDSAEYQQICLYLEGLVKKYHNRCLFLFAYRKENPGFSYRFLPCLKKYAFLAALKEGSGNRREALSFLKSLIRSSEEYKQYADQAEEFMKILPGEKFTQTDVLQALERFETWCLSQNVLREYLDSSSDVFLLDRNQEKTSSYEKLMSMTGLAPVKEKICRILQADAVEKERKIRGNGDYEAACMHMIFEGNPGTAKTTVARLFAGLAKAKGILKSGAFVECAGMDLEGIASPLKIRDAFLKAEGGVLFIDEAYSLCSDTAVTQLIREMESRREDVIVIFAGYRERMQKFLKINEGLKSRIPYVIDFPDYKEEELTEIFRQMLRERGFCAEEEAVRQARRVFEKAACTDNFGNGRFVRNLMENAIQNQSCRLMKEHGSAADISKEELFLIRSEDITTLEEGLEERRLSGTARKELDEMIGLASVKKVIRKAIAGFRLRMLYMERNIPHEKASMHMVFTGNPGTAKTTVARLFAEILKDEKILPSGNFVEAGRADLIGSYVGQTAPLVKKKFQEAKGGVLFIDEAYALCDDTDNSYADEAINTIVQEMENHREDVIVIFAGYPDPMKDFLERNPGMLSRIAYQIRFEDYTAEELSDITKLMLRKKQMKITDAAMKKLRKEYEAAVLTDNYGNGRFVRKVLEEAQCNLAERIFQKENTELTEDVITTIEETDIPDVFFEQKIQKKPLGFCA